MRHAPSPSASRAGVGEGTGAVATDGGDGPARSLPIWLLLWALLALPLIVALAVLWRPKWYPLLDFAMTEMRVRDVASTHPPLIGLPGRIGTLGNQGSHPGPLSFYAMWPIWRVLGASSWAFEAAMATLQVLAMGAALWIARRRGGLALVVAVAAVV